jgi:hypothetical protein
MIRAHHRYHYAGVAAHVYAIIGGDVFWAWRHDSGVVCKVTRLDRFAAGATPLQEVAA